MKQFTVFFTIYLAQVISEANGATLETLQVEIAEAEKTLHLQITKTKSSIAKSIARQIETVTSRSNSVKTEISSSDGSCQVWGGQVDFVTKPLSNKALLKPCVMSSDLKSLQYRTDASLQDVRKNVERLDEICRLLVYNCELQMESVSGDLKNFHRRVVLDLGDVKYKSLTCVSGNLKPIKDGLENIYKEWKNCK